MLIDRVRTSLRYKWGMADPKIELTSQLFAVSEQLVAMAVSGLTREEALRSPDGGPNPIIWTFGHITNTRCGILAMLGRPQEVQWKELFGKGARLRPDTDYPAMEEIQAVWDDVSPKLRERLATVTVEELAVTAPRKFRIADDTLAGAVAYLGYHEAYHVGQMAYVRKWLGKGSMVG